MVQRKDCYPVLYRVATFALFFFAVNIEKKRLITNGFLHEAPAQ